MNISLTQCSKDLLRLFLCVCFVMFFCYFVFIVLFYFTFLLVCFCFVSFLVCFVFLCTIWFVLYFVSSFVMMFKNVFQKIDCSSFLHFDCSTSELTALNIIDLSLKSPSCNDKFRMIEHICFNYFLVLLCQHNSQFRIVNYP